MKKAREDEDRNAYSDSITRRNKAMRVVLCFGESYLPSSEKVPQPSAPNEKPAT